MFVVHRFQSVLIFSIINHPCSSFVAYYLFGVFLSFFFSFLIRRPLFMFICQIMAHCNTPGNVRLTIFRRWILTRTKPFSSWNYVLCHPHERVMKLLHIFCDLKPVNLNMQLQPRPGEPRMKFLRSPRIPEQSREKIAFLLNTGELKSSENEAKTPSLLRVSSNGGWAPGVLNNWCISCTTPFWTFHATL